MVGFTENIIQLVQVHHQKLTLCYKCCSRPLFEQAKCEMYHKKESIKKWILQKYDFFSVKLQPQQRIHFQQGPLKDPASTT